jgi:predicted GTPase
VNKGITAAAAAVAAAVAVAAAAAASIYMFYAKSASIGNVDPALMYSCSHRRMLFKSKQAGIKAVLESAKALNPQAEVYITASEVSVDKPDLVIGKRMLCVEDGPTTTHGGMSSGAAAVAAAKYGAAEVVDPRPYFVGELKATLEKYPHIGKVVPAMGYSEQQVSAVPC